MLTVKQLEKVNSIEQLEKLGIGNVAVEIGSRGGGLGFYQSDVAKALNVPAQYLPNKYGAGCNYLGGGVRGAIFASGYSKHITGKKANLLDALAAACIRAYKNAEDGAGMNDEEEEGETNWDAKATNAVRKSGITSAY